MNIVSSLRMKEIDRISIEEKGFGDFILMENAGIRILEEAEKIVDFDCGFPVVCVAGSGNNGGDALVIARQIFSRFKNPVTVIISGSPRGGTGSYTFHLNLCTNLGIRILDFEKSPEEEIVSELNGAGLVFDGLSGTGIRGKMRRPASDIAGLINDSGAVKIAIDLPSGTGESFRKGFPSVAADYTLTVGLPKRCLYLPAARSRCGEIRIVSIGFPEELKNEPRADSDRRDWVLANEDDINRLMPKLEPDDYKNSRGHVAVFAGSMGTTGAASLCAEAAIRTSAGLVSLFADEDIYPLLAVRHKAVMVKPMTDEASCGAAGSYGSIAAGPGWGVAGRESLLQRLISEGRGVLDADGINVLSAVIAQSGKYPDLGGRWVLTPHAGEFRRLFPDVDEEDDPLVNPYSAVVKAADALNCVILLKGAVTFIAEPSEGRCAVIDGCFPKLGTAGAGDLLCGLIAGYAASGLDIFESALLGALVHLRSAAKCAEEREWFAADDLLEFL